MSNTALDKGFSHLLSYFALTIVQLGMSHFVSFVPLVGDGTEAPGSNWEYVSVMIKPSL